MQSRRWFSRYRPNIRNRQFDPREEFPVSEEFLNRVDFSPRVAELQRMVLERTGSNVPSLQFLRNTLSRWSGTQAKITDACKKIHNNLTFQYLLSNVGLD